MNSSSLPGEIFLVNSDDQQLVIRIRAKDPDAMAEYAQLRRSHLLAFIEKNMSDALRRKIDAEDIFQETAADAVRSLDDMDLSERDPFSWLCQIAQRRIVDAHRFHFGAKKRDAAREVALGTPGGETQSPGLINLLVASMTSPSQAFSRNAREARLAEALAELPETQREALRLRYVESWPSKKIAQQLNKSDAAVRVMLTRSLKQLQTLLEI